MSPFIWREPSVGAILPALLGPLTPSQSAEVCFRRRELDQFSTEWMLWPIQLTAWPEWPRLVAFLANELPAEVVRFARSGTGRSATESWTLAFKPCLPCPLLAASFIRNFLTWACFIKEFSRSCSSFCCLRLPNLLSNSGYLEHSVPGSGPGVCLIHPSWLVLKSERAPESTRSIFGTFSYGRTRARPSAVPAFMWSPSATFGVRMSLGRAGS